MSVSLAVDRRGREPRRCYIVGQAGQSMCAMINMRGNAICPIEQNEPCLRWFTHVSMPPSRTQSFCVPH